MSTPFVVTARKYRPQTFEDVLGQEHITRTLRNALSRGKIAHAYLFSGPRGTGKTTTARIFAKAINCVGDVELKPCNTCSICQSITAGKQVDVIEIDAASNRGIDNIRDLRREVLIAPAEAMFKVYIIDEVHMLSLDAFNALLKTLEEPPSHVKFVLATTEIQKIPPTILSRCQRFSFRRVPVSVLVEGLGKILDAEAAEHIPPDMREQALYAVARVGEGSVRDSQSALDQLISFAYEGVTLDEIRTMLGLVSTDLIDAFIRDAHSGNIQGALEGISQAINEGIDAKNFLADLIQYYRDLLVAKDVTDLQDLVDLPAESLEQIKATAAQLSREDLLRAMEILWEAETRLRSSGEGRIVLESAALRIASLPQSVQIQQVLDYLESLSQQMGSGSSRPSANVTSLPSQQTDLSQEHSNETQEKKKSPAVTESAKSVTSNRATPATTTRTPPAKSGKDSQDRATPNLGRISDHWSEVVASVRSGDATLGSCLLQAVPVRLDQGVLALGLPPGYQYHADVLSAGENPKMIRDALQRETGYTLNVTVEFSPDIRPIHLNGDDGQPLDGEKQKKVTQLVEDNAVLRDFIKRIDGKVLDVRSLGKTSGELGLPH